MIEKKPDEGRLLTRSDYMQYLIDNNLGWRIEYQVSGLAVDVIAKAQRDLTASIKESEFIRALNTQKDATQLSLETKDKMCQERVEGIFKEIEKHYTATFHGYDNIFLTQGEWQSLKKKELK